MTVNTYPKLLHAPIEEAILTVGFDTGCNTDELSTIQKCLQVDYPVVKTWINNRAQFTQNIETNSIEVLQEKSHRGYILTDSNENKVFYISDNELVLNQIKPYQDWENFSKLYEKAFKQYHSVCTIKRINNIALRYINKFEIPLDKWQEQLLMYPNMKLDDVQDSSPTFLVETTTNYKVISEHHLAIADVILILNPSEGGSLSVILDIEVNSRIEHSDYNNYAFIIETLDRLRSFKNKIFFSNIPNAKELFNA